MLKGSVSEFDGLLIYKECKERSCFQSYFQREEENDIPFHDM